MERNIDKVDLKAAIKYGKRTECLNLQGKPNGRFEYDFQDMIFVTDEKGHEITVYTKSMPLVKYQINDSMKF